MSQADKVIKPILVTLCVGLILVAACVRQHQPGRPTEAIAPPSIVRPLPANASPQVKQLIASAIDQTRLTTGYDPAYVSIAYPGGDVSLKTGVCSDVIVRAFRKAGIDLQREVHEDMKSAWSAYPKKWQAGAPDTNIDHRRVLNLMTYFERKGKALPATTDRKDYFPGDLVTWDLGGGIDHIGILTNLSSEPDGHWLIVHNIGAGTRVEDVLLSWRITGHYRYFR